MSCYGSRHFAPKGKYAYFHPHIFKQKRKKRMRGNLFGLLVAIGGAAIFVVSTFYYLAAALGRIAFDPASRAWRELANRLRERLKSVAAGALVPWDGEMLSLLSLNRTSVKKSNWWDSHSEGVFTTIYQEPVLAYTGQQRGATAAYAARTSDKEFIFRKKEKETEVWLNGQPLGVFIKGALYAPGRSTQKLAECKADPAEAQWPVVMGDRTVAALANPAQADGPIPRALSLLRALSAEEEEIVLALVLVYGLEAAERRKR
jgi:hypothetical protein